MFRALNNAKIGNILRYFASEINNLPMMKALKLLYLLDETSFKARGLSVTGLEYKAWEAGPVAKPVWEELRHGKPTHDQVIGEFFTFDEYITIVRHNKPQGVIEIQIKAKGDFDDNEFSRAEVKLLKGIADKYGHLTGSMLSEITHRTDSPWTKTVTSHNLTERFEHGDRTPDVTIDLVMLIQHDAEKMEAYLASRASMEFRQDMIYFGKNGCL